MATSNRQLVLSLILAALVGSADSCPVAAKLKRPVDANPPGAKPAVRKPALMEVELGEQFLAASRFFEAIKCFERANKLVSSNDPLKPRLLVDLALAQLSLGRDEDAAKTMEEVSARYPTYKSQQRTRLDAVFHAFQHAAVHTDEASKLLTEGKTRAAITEYEVAIEHMPNNAEFYILLALAYKTLYIGTKDDATWRKAQKAFDTIKRLDPQQFDEVKKDAVKP